MSYIYYYAGENKVGSPVSRMDGSVEVRKDGETGGQGKEHFWGK
jgi:hypothetical protein